MNLICKILGHKYSIFHKHIPSLIILKSGEFKEKPNIKLISICKRCFDSTIFTTVFTPFDKLEKSE